MASYVLSHVLWAKEVWIKGHAHFVLFCTVRCILYYDRYVIISVNIQGENNAA